MECYSCFAAIYDRMMAHVPQDAWAGYLHARARTHFPSGVASLLDLACGTGRILSHINGFAGRLHGMDLSGSMLAIAKKRIREGSFRKGMLQGPLPYSDRSFPWVICCHDSLNYLKNIRELKGHFREVYRILKEGGVYSVDSVTLDAILFHNEQKEVVHEHPPYRILWTGSYYPKKELLVTDLIFEREGKRIGTERHEQRYYATETIVNAAASAGFVLLQIDGNYRRRRPRSGDSLTNFHFQKK